ncbi:MAG: hypothetical protein Q8P91_02685 [bacterium]|nr:hypothetical protein [bacterium]
MIPIQTLTKNDKSVRTQITLTQTLKYWVEKMANERGESLSEYLRKAAMIRLLLEREEKRDLENLAKRVIGSIDPAAHPEWSTMEKVDKWVRDIREEK